MNWRTSATPDGGSCRIARVHPRKREVGEVVSSGAAVFFCRTHLRRRLFRIAVLWWTSSEYLVERPKIEASAAEIGTGPIDKPIPLTKTSFSCGIRKEVDDSERRLFPAEFALLPIVALIVCYKLVENLVGIV